MSCNSPNKVFYLGVNEDSGKRIIAYCPRSTDFLIVKPDGSYDKQVGDPKKAHINFGERVVTDCDLVPCGQCIGCRIDYSRDWAVRLMLEKKKFPDNECFFITLTYDNDHLPKYYATPQGHCYTSFPDKDFVEDFPVMLDAEGAFIKSPFDSVSTRDHQIFMKRLRDRFGKGLRMFASLEYGEKSFRPHEHLIVFGLKDFPLNPRPWKKNFNGDPLYESDCLTGDRGIWTDKNGVALGRALVSRVTFDCCNYVTRYIVKKRNKVSRQWYEAVNIEPERCFMSRRPGIASDFVSSHIDDIYAVDEVSVSGRDGAITVKPPRFFDSLLDRVDPDRLLDVKELRKKQKDLAEQFRLKQYPSLDLEDVYSAREDKLSQRIIIKKGGEI